MPANLHDWILRWSDTRPATVLLTAATPMDEEGNLYMSTCLINEAEALKSPALRKIIVQVNPKMPRLKPAEGKIHISQIDALIEAEDDLWTVPSPIPTDNDKIIGQTAAEFIHDGDTIQVGWWNRGYGSTGTGKQEGSWPAHRIIYTRNRKSGSQGCDHRGEKDNI